MAVTTAIEADIAKVVVDDRIDSGNAADVQTQLLQLVQSGHHKVLIDLSGLEYLSSAGLRVFLVLAKQLKAAGGKLVLHSMTDNVKSVFTISGFIKMLTVVDSAEEALASF
ncbi:STAS domain-containing protein [Rhodovibrionaceae bacterium A322]